MASFFYLIHLKMRSMLLEKVDFLFIGMGAANSLLLLKMHENDLLKNKKIAIIEPNSKVVNDRNFCFWCTEDELLNLNLEDLVSSKWNQIKVVNRTSQTISPLNYYHIRGIDLYNKVKATLNNHKISYYKDPLSTEPLVKHESFVINLPETKIEAKIVFDSRPPTYEIAQKNQSHLLQSFYGWEVIVQDYTFDKSTMVMMDFDIPQNNCCQFMYILPFSENKALFEVTRFGKEKITRKEAEKLLTDYLIHQDFSYQIIEEERGVIPMSSTQIAEVNFGKNWIITGARANLIKPTTGYAFHSMAIDAQKQVEAMLNHKSLLRHKHATRFKFYDNLLLKILEETPQHGKRIFQALFNHVPINNVLTFLSEKSTLKNELYLFSKLPILLFLRIAFKDISYRFTTIPPALLAGFTTFIAICLYALNLEKVLFLFLGMGFLSIGLSHGALDYLTDKTIQNNLHYLKFILSYLIKGALLGLLWFVLPDLALLVFIAFSAWHFGQADVKEWNHKQGLNSFLWGLIVLINILFFHLHETITVLQHINGLKIHHFFDALSPQHVFIGKLWISFGSLIFIAYNKSRLMLLTWCYLMFSSWLPLLISFGIYFVVQHSTHGWKHLKKDLKIDSYPLWLKSLPFSTGGALIFLIFALVNSSHYLGLFFILLSCISVPHVISMNHFYKQFKQKGIKV